MKQVRWNSFTGKEVTMALRRIDTVIVGGGQAGLAISYFLKQEGRELRGAGTSDRRS
jgi:hypothetical protein